MRLPVVARWFLSLPAAMFFCLAASGLHKSLGSPSGAPAVAATLASVLFLSSMALWVIGDARQRQRSIPYDFGSFIFFAWPLVVPIYLFSTRGWRGFAPLGYFLLLYLAAGVVGSIPLLLDSMGQ